MIAVVATHNKGKAAEFAHMLGSVAPGVKWVDLSAFPDVGEVEETGDTFETNARLKASEYARRTNHWALADDSGLSVDALAGKPGVVSARWAMLHNFSVTPAPARPDSAKPTSADANNNALLLKQLDSIPDTDRTARFVCVLALANPSGEVVLAAHGTVEGRIIRQARGSHGFGYDPLFLVDALGKTTAELTPAEKAAVSHRGHALRQLAKALGERALGELWARSKGKS